MNQPTLPAPEIVAPAVEPKRLAGRHFTTFVPEAAETICQRVSEGKSIRQIAEDESLPSRETIYLWLRENKEFADQFALSRREHVEDVVSDLLGIADDTSRDWIVTPEGLRIFNAEHVARSRLKIDTRKWIASKLLPKVYGEKSSPDLTIQNTVSNIVVLSPERQEELQRWRRQALERG